MIVHCAASIRQLPSGELCHFLDKQLRDHGRRLITMMPTMLQPEIATPENPNQIPEPGLFIVFQQDVSDEEYQRILAHKPKPGTDRGPAEGPTKANNRLLHG